MFSCVFTEEGLSKRPQAAGQTAIDKYGEQLEAFREMVLSKMVRLWYDKKDIKIAIGETLSQFSRRDDIGGWVRQNQEANLPALADEIARLSSENARLRTIVENTSLDETINGLKFSEMRDLVERQGGMELLVRSDVPLSNGTLSWNKAIQDQLQCLTNVGLVQQKPGPGYVHYMLTAAGHAFMNKLKYLELRSASDSEQSS